MAEGRHRASTTRRFPPALLAIPVIIAAGVAVWLLFLRGEESLVKKILPTEGPDMTVPDFSFVVRRASAVPTAGERDHRPSAEVKRAAKDVGEALSGLYTQAFLDPENWREGTFDDVWGMFEGAAADAAADDVEVLTVGSTAGAGFDDIEPRGGSLTARVLTDPKGQPAAVAATVRFTALASATDGTTTVLTSEGNYFLERVGGDWRIVSYDVRRADKIREPVPGPTASPSAGETP